MLEAGRDELVGTDLLARLYGVGPHEHGACVTAGPSVARGGEDRDAPAIVHHLVAVPVTRHLLRGRARVRVRVRVKGER